MGKKKHSGWLPQKDIVERVSEKMGISKNKATRLLIHAHYKEFPDEAPEGWRSNLV